MRLMAIVVFAALLATPSFARSRGGHHASKSYAPKSARPVRVKGYTKKNGTYVAPHYRRAPNKTQRDNYSSTGNVNPYTGKDGEVEPKK